MPPADSNRTNHLMALGSAAVLAVYAAGYFRTAPAAARLAAAERARVVIPQEARDNHGAVAPGPAPIAPPSAASVAPATPASAASPASPDPRIRKAPALAPESRPLATASPEPTSTPTPAATPTLSPTPEPAISQPTAPVYKDGTYSGWGTSRHGDIQATVVIENGRISSAVISQCWTRYSCSWVSHLQGQVVARQSPEVDYVSGATQSTNAFYYGVVQALSKAK